MKRRITPEEYGEVCRQAAQHVVDTEEKGIEKFRPRELALVIYMDMSFEHDQGEEPGELVSEDLADIIESVYEQMARLANR